MSLEQAIDIFTRQGFKNPQWAVDVIQKATTLEVLAQIMRDENTSLSADQFVSCRIGQLFKGDPEFARRTSEHAKEQFKQYGLSDEIVDFYILNGGGVDQAISLQFKISLGDFAPVKDMKKLHEFCDVANQYLFDALRDYVVGSSV